MRIHRLNCITTRLRGGRLIDGTSRGVFTRGRCVNHCLAVETGDGLLLIDTGLGLGDVMDPAQRLAPAMRSMLQPELRAEMTAVRQIERMGFRAEDVHDIVLTHLDFDQAGGLDDFPRARVHLFARERDVALAQHGRLARQRYRPVQWSTRARWVAHAKLSDSPWMGLACLRDLPGLPQEIVLVPLPGHTAGHCGVAVRADNRWHLHAGDAYFDARQLDADPQCRLGLKVYEWAMQTDGRARIETQRKLRALHAAHPDIIMSCTHDVRDFERLAGRPAHVPADQVTALPRNEYSEKIVRARPVSPVPPMRPVPTPADGFDREVLAPRMEAPPQPRP